MIDNIGNIDLEKHITGNDLCVSTEVIAEQIGYSHETVRDCITRYKGDFTKFGKLRFKNGTVTNSVGAVNNTKKYMLNKGQAILLFTFLRNNETIKNFKIKLVQTYLKLEASLYGELNDVTAVALANFILKVTEEKKGLVEKLDHYDKMLGDDTLYNLRDVAKMVGIKESLLATILIDNKWLYRDVKKQLQAYSTIIDKKLAFMKAVNKELLNDKQKYVIKTHLKFTKKGIEKIYKLLNQKEVVNG